MMDDLPEPEPKTPHRGKKRSNTQCRSTGQSMGQKRGHGNRNGPKRRRPSQVRHTDPLQDLASA